MLMANDFTGDQARVILEQQLSGIFPGGSIKLVGDLQSGGDDPHRVVVVRRGEEYRNFLVFPSGQVRPEVY